MTGLPMNNRSWQILCWNIRGLNGRDKWDAVRTKIDESACAVLCLQETKRAHFDKAFIRNFAPRRFDSFDYIPSEGASGGLLLLWNSSIFSATIIDKHCFAITATFCSVHNSNT
jgi:exonuclease III